MTAPAHPIPTGTSTLICAVTAAINSGDAEAAQRLVKRQHAAGGETNTITDNLLLKLYTKSRTPVPAQRLFEEMKKREHGVDVVSYRYFCSLSSQLVFGIGEVF